MVNSHEGISIIIKKGKRKIIIKSPSSGKSKFVLVINNQFTNAPNTTQIASGAGKSSAAGNNAAINSPNTNQQQSVGAGGTAKNIGIKGRDSKLHNKSNKQHHSREVHIIINNQIAKRPKGVNSSATQVASGSGKYSTAGTNSAIESSNTKQQHAVGGGKGSLAINKRLNVKTYKTKRK